MDGKKNGARATRASYTCNNVTKEDSLSQVLFAACFGWRGIFQAEDMEMRGFRLIIGLKIFEAMPAV